MALRHADIALAIVVLRAVPVGHPRISPCRRAIVNRAYGLDRPASIPNALQLFFLEMTHSGALSINQLQPLPE